MTMALTSKMKIDDLTIAYMVKGATSNPKHLEKAAQANGEGELEYIREVIDLAVIVEEQFNAYYHDGNYSGVFAYDVAGPIGKWITEQTVLDDGIPRQLAVAKKAAELITQHID